MNSIRGRLLLYLVPALLVIYSLTAWRVLTVTAHEAEEVFDAELAHFARIVLNLTHHELQEEQKKTDIDNSQSVLPAITGHLFQGVLKPNAPGGTDNSAPGHPYELKLVFQIWTTSNQEVFRSDGAPTKRLSENNSGFTNNSIGQRGWRVFSISDDALGITIQVGEDNAVREELVAQIISNMFAPLLLGLGLIVGLVWILVGWGLTPTRKLTTVVTQRDRDHLEPIKTSGTPSELLPLVQSLNALLSRLKRALDNERRFTSDAAHEIRTPLAGLKLQAQVALGAADDTTRRTALRSIDQAVDRTMRLVEQLLTMARYDSGLPRTAIQQVDLNNVAADVIAQIEPSARSRNIELTLLRDAKASAPGDLGMLQVMLRNLVDNAVRYNHANGSVEIRLRQKGREVILEVSDTGPGIAEQHRTAVFDRFRRLAHQDGNGTGLGLSITARIVELHGGRISVTERPGGGAQFTVTLPRD